MVRSGIAGRLGNNVGSVILADAILGGEGGLSLLITCSSPAVHGLVGKRLSGSVAGGFLGDTPRCEPGQRADDVDSTIR